jgi:hypothetical protein
MSTAAANGAAHSNKTTVPRRAARPAFQEQGDQSSSEMSQQTNDEEDRDWTRVEHEELAENYAAAEAAFRRWTIIDDDEESASVPASASTSTSAQLDTPPSPLRIVPVHSNAARRDGYTYTIRRDQNGRWREERLPNPEEWPSPAPRERERETVVQREPSPPPSSISSTDPLLDNYAILHDRISPVERKGRNFRFAPKRPRGLRGYGRKRKSGYRTILDEVLENDGNEEGGDGEGEQGGKKKKKKKREGYEFWKKMKEGALVILGLLVSAGIVVGWIVLGGARV